MGADRAPAKAVGRIAGMVAGARRHTFRITLRSGQEPPKREGRAARRLLLAAALSSAVPFASAGGAEPSGPDRAPCGDSPDTFAIVACADREAKAWDRRLNAAYAALQRRIEAGQRDPLRTAQRLWVRYRDANCRFYGSQDGSIRHVHAAECVRAMTEARAIELEKAMISE